MICCGSTADDGVGSRHRREVSGIDHFEETEVLIHFELFSGVDSLLICLCSLFRLWDAIQSITVEVHFGNRVKVLALPLLELLTVHTGAQL